MTVVYSVLGRKHFRVPFCVAAPTERRQKNCTSRSKADPILPYLDLGSFWPSQSIFRPINRKCRDTRNTKNVWTRQARCCLRVSVPLLPSAGPSLLSESVTDHISPSAGVTGLTSALFLTEAGYQVTVVAAHVPGDSSIEYTSPW